MMEHLNKDSVLYIEHKVAEHRPSGYPVIHLGLVIIFPSMKQVEILRDALTAYLDKHAAAELKATQDATDAAFAKLGVE